MGPVVVAVDVGADRVAGFVEGFELLAPDAALLKLGEPALDERLALGVQSPSTPTVTGSRRSSVSRISSSSTRYSNPSRSTAVSLSCHTSTLPCWRSVRRRCDNTPRLLAAGGDQRVSLRAFARRRHRARTYARDRMEGTRVAWSPRATAHCLDRAPAPVSPHALDGHAADVIAKGAAAGRASLPRDSTVEPSSPAHMTACDVRSLRRSIAARPPVASLGDASSPRRPRRPAVPHARWACGACRSASSSRRRGRATPGLSEAKSQRQPGASRTCGAGREANRPNAGGDAGGLEAARDVAPIERSCRSAVHEDEIVVGAVGGALRPAIELGGEPRRHRYRA